MRSHRFALSLFNLILILALAAGGLIALSQPAQAISETVVISQVYGGGGNTGAPYTNDFVELFNRSTTPVSVTGWSVQYASATGTGNFGSNPVALLSGTLAPGQYYLVQLSGGTTGTPLPPADATGTANMSGSAGKVALINSTAGLACNGGSTPCSLAQLSQIVDLVGWGSANFFEGSAAAPATTNASAVQRLMDGCTETDNNGADFVNGSPSPRNSASPFHVCTTGLNPPIINEFVANHVGTDTHEYVEVFGDPNTDYSSYSLLHIEGDGSGAGVIDTVIPISTTNISGFWTTGFLSNVFENGTITLLLVEGFTGTIGTDLDTNNDGVLDAVPWVSVVDDVAVNDGGAGDRTYSSTVLAPGLSGSLFTPGGASRIPNGVDTDSVSDWTVNDFDGEGLPGFTGTLVVGEALNTPEAINVVLSGSTSLVINEIDYDQPSTDTAEFIEIKNTSGSSIDLSGYGIALVNGTGGGALIYQTIPLPNVSLAANDYYVVCGNASTVANCDLDVSPDTNLIQNGAPDAVALVLGDEIVDTVSYEGNTGAPYTEGSGSGLDDSGATDRIGISRFPDGFDSNLNNEDFQLSCITPGESNTDSNTGCLPVEVCGDPFTPIYAIQGSGLESPLDGQSVATEGIVVGDFQNTSQSDNGDLNGFYIQDPSGDGNPATSDGIFVFAPGSIDVSVGDNVRVRGTVDEFNGLTEITNVSTSLQCSTGNLLPAATLVDLPVTSLNDFEPFEGMLVTFQQTLYISEYFNFDRFGEIVLTVERQFQPTAVFEPGSVDAANLALANSLSRITLDDGRTVQNPDPAIHPNGNVFNLDNLFRGGDTVQNVTGVMDYSFGFYRIHPTQGADYTSANPRTQQPDDVGGNLKVASFNVLNYFTTIDTGAEICGPEENQECRGADDLEEFNRQRSKIIAALKTMDADVVGLIEIENHPADVPTSDLVNGLNDLMGAGTYDFISTGAIGSDAIRVALIYKPSTVTPFGAYSVLDTSVDPRFLDGFNRPVLAQSFRDNARGGIFTVAVNHLKSKGSDCNAIGDPDIGDGQGNCNLTRKAAAEALVDWLASDPTGSGNDNTLIIGDLNSYDKEDPIDVILAGDYADLVFQYMGEYAYSYVFDGQLGYLDHALASSSLTTQVTGATVWHINADEPDLIDYDTGFKLPAQDAIFSPDAYRSSDHDPVIVGLQLNVPPMVSADPAEQSVQYSDPAADVTITGADVTADIPLSIATEWKVGAGDFASGLPDWLVLTDTGCETDTYEGICTWNLSGTALTVPDIYTVRLTVTDLSGDSTYVDLTFTVTQEDALATYTGARFAATASPTSNTATVTLAATIQDFNDGFPGDIRNATVTFVNRDEGNAELCSAPVGLVNPADTTTGTVACTWDVNIGNSDGIIATVGILVDGFYSRNETSDDAIVTVSRALTSNFITGGGYLLLTNSNGQLSGDPGSHNSFGFTVKYNNSGRNLQGRISTMLISGGRVYQIKGNVLSSLVVNAEVGTAIFNGRATIQDVTDPDNPLEVDGNATLQVTLTDNGEPGSSDSIGITIWNKSGGLYFASHWDGVMTLEQVLAGGNLIVH